ncbi:MAG: preprotein translocase subunit SecE [Candidatus Magasanikbacteria bacterium]|nr:preprotein translocase subunit SecE [Candidatus Magasanikbacteria bacterium]
MALIDSAKNYFLGSYAEMKKVSWPTKQQTINYSFLVIGLSIGLAAFFALLDYFFNWGITALLTR